MCVLEPCNIMHGLVVACCTLMLNHTVHQYAAVYTQAMHDMAGSQYMKKM